MAVVIVVAAGAAFGVVKSGVLNKKTATPSASGQPTQPTQPSQTPAAAAGTGTTNPTAGTTATTAAAQNQLGLAAPFGDAKVGTFYGIVQHTLDPNGAMNSDPPAVPKLFADTSTLPTYWSSAGKPTAAATCGVKSPTLAVVEPPASSSGSGASGSGSTVRVDLFVKGELAAKAAAVGIDERGDITSIKCVPSAMPTYPGLSYILSTYGKNQVPGEQIKPSHTYAPTAQDAPSPDQEVEGNVCTQYVPDSWVFYAPVATTAGTAWRFSFDQVTYPLSPNLFVDPTSGDVERIICEGLPSIPASDPAAAGKDSHVYGGDPADAQVMYVLQAYARERSLISAGAKPTAEVAPYFASDAVFQTALSGTGKIPLLCTGKDPFWVVASGIGTVNGTTESVAVTVLGPPTDGNRADTPTIGKATYTVDLITMKITGITCR